MKLGNLELASGFLLAPLESVSDAPFRRLCWSLGAAFTFTEMIRARGLARKNRSTIELIDSFEPEVPTGLQLLVANERELGAALEVLDALAVSTHPHLMNLSAVDLNFGCPSPEVIRVGAGPALLKRHGKLKTIFSVLRTWKTQTPIPIKAITAKVRLGLNRAEMDQRVYLPIVEVANELLDGLTVHARHAREASTDPAHWEAIAAAKALAAIPIFGNGDVTSASAASRMIAETKCDGVMIARGAIRSPWVFRELTQRGAGVPTRDEIDAAERAWTDGATRWGSKPKFFEWHREGFERMRRRLLGADDQRLPKNENLS